jgi:hypothetical protein
VEITLRNDELLPAREASRALGQAIGRLSQGRVEKYVIVNRNEMQAVLLSVDAYAALVRSSSECEACETLRKAA